MGANLCCFKNSTESQASEATTSCSRCNYQVVPHRGKKVCDDNMVKYATLNEFLLNSPAEAANGNGFYTPRVSLSLSPAADQSHVMNAGYFSPRISFSSDLHQRLAAGAGKIEETDDDERKLTSSGSRIGRFKKHKKVSFRMPEEADVIVFYSPPQDLVALSLHE